MRQSTVSDYNSKDRAIEFCVDIYFNGLEQDPLHCTRANYLINCDVLDEACSDTDTFIGAPSANEVSFQLFGSSGLFNPLNASGEYYNKINVGTPLKVYCRPINLTDDTDNDYEWDQLGTFYVSDWVTDLTGITADVTGYDKLYSLITDFVSKVPVVIGQTYGALLNSFMTYNGLSVTSVGDLSEQLDFGFIDKSNNEFLQEFCIGALLYIFCTHTGSIEALDIDRTSSIDFVLTDDDQIISIKSSQSIVSKYDGVALQYAKVQLSEDAELLNDRDKVKTTAYNETYNGISFSKKPVYAVTRSNISSAVNVLLSTFDATPLDISYTVNGGPGYFDISFNGNVLEFIDVSLADSGANLLNVSTRYAQNYTYAERLKGLLTKYATVKVPTLTIEARGNPLYTIGSKLHVVSAQFNVDFTGILIRQHFKYDGGLSSELTLLNSEVVGV